MSTNTRNKIMIIVISLIALGLAVYYLIFPTMIKNLFSFTNKDVNNVNIEGYVYDQNKKTVENYTLYITNYYYEGGDGESYMGGEKTPVLTNENGHYSIHFDKSCNVQIDNVKEGYSKSLIVQDITKPTNKIDFHLK